MPFKPPTWKPPKPTKVSRPSSAARGYGYQWKKLRRQVLADFPFCFHCGQLAKHVDHVKPLRQGGSHDPSNLQPLCVSCHNKKIYRDGSR